MPSSLRDLVERTIRDALPDLESLDLDGAAPDAGADDHAAEADDGTPGSGAATPPARSPAELALEAEFTALGFRRGHVLRALAYVRSGSAAPPTRNDVLAHLHLLVPESDLPPAFRDARPADATIRNATARDAGELGRMWQAERVAREVGAPVEWVRGETERARAATARENVTDGELEGMVVDVLARRLMDVPPGADEDERDKLGEDVLRAAWGAGAGPSNLSQEEKDELRQRRDDEVLGLEGLFGSRFRRTKDGIEIAVPHKGDRLSLRVLFHPGSSYPSPHTPPAPVALPSFFISSPTLPPYIRLHLHTLLASQFRPSVAQDGSAWLDLAEAGYGGVVGEMVSFLEARVRSAIEHPPDAREVMDRLVSPSERPTAPLAAGDAAKKVTRTQHAQRRGPPKGLRASPEQQMALKRAYEELCRTEGYQRMLEGRKRLPAWSMRDKIVDLIRNERVVIVCGETGSGKTTQGLCNSLLVPAAEESPVLTPLACVSARLCPRGRHHARRGRDDLDCRHAAPSSERHWRGLARRCRAVRGPVPLEHAPPVQPRRVRHPRRASCGPGDARTLLHDGCRARAARAGRRSRPAGCVAHLHRRGPRAQRRLGLSPPRAA